MTSKIDKGCSMLNAADETANPLGLILSEREREIIYGKLNRLENMTNALLYGKTGRKQQVQAAFSAAGEFIAVGVAAMILHYFANIPTMSTFIIGIGFILLQQLNLLLMHERIEDNFARRNREDEKEAREHAKHFKDVGCKDMSLEE